MMLTLTSMMILFAMALDSVNSQTTELLHNPTTSRLRAPTSPQSIALPSPGTQASASTTTAGTASTVSQPGPEISLEDVITISGWCVTIITGFGSLIVSAWFFHLSTKQVIAAQATQTETNNHIRNFLTRIVTELQFLKDAGTRTEEVLQSVQVEMSRKLAMHSVETMEGSIKQALTELTMKLGERGNTKQVLDETAKAIEAAAQTSRNTVLAFQSSLQVLASLDRESMTVALASLKLSTSGAKPALASIAAISEYEQLTVSRAMERLTNEGVTSSDCSLNESFRNALNYLLSAVEEYPGMRFQERVNALLECLHRATRTR
ncbi:MAG: hypothetical protein JNL10_20185 [Verrucomicrobiales bacterium]|nr:hypothetical protein [Verrucomicrobiales bacterium]